MNDTTGFIDQNTKEDWIEVCPGGLIENGFGEG